MLFWTLLDIYVLLFRLFKGISFYIYTLHTPFAVLIIPANQINYVYCIGYV